MEPIHFFHADFGDGRIHVGGKKFYTGAFAVRLLNEFYKNDAAAKVSAFKLSNLMVQTQLAEGYVNTSDFVACAQDMCHSLEAVAGISPFPLLDVAGERDRINALFTEENAEQLMDYLRMKGSVAEMDAGAKVLGVLPKGYNKELFAAGETLLSEVKATLTFYDTLGQDMITGHNALAEFVEREDEAERLDEVHLASIAREVFAPTPAPLKVDYISANDCKGNVPLRRLWFERFYSFIVTDFFEGISCGHYPRQCRVCGRYFLMRSAARQKYCNGYAPIKVKGKAITCKNYGARIKQKELAENDPIQRLYRNRCAAIRVGISRSKLVPEFGEAAKQLAKERMQRARMDPEYAKGQYLLDMSQDKLYTDTDRRLKGGAGDGQ